MTVRKIAFWSLRGQLTGLVAIILIPVIFGLLFTGYRQYRLSLGKIEREAQRLLLFFSQEQLQRVSCSRHFLLILTSLPGIQVFDTDGCRMLLKKLNTADFKFSGLMLADGHGKVLCSTSYPAGSINVADRAWFRRVKREQQLVVGDFVIGPSNQNAFLPLAAPVLDSFGEFKGVVTVALDLNFFNRTIERMALPPDAVVWITDRTQTLLFDSLPGSGSSVGKPLPEAKGIRLPDSGSGRLVTTDADGTARIYWYQWVWNSHRSNRICVVVGISKKSIFAGAAQTMWLHVCMILLVALIAVIIAGLISKRLIYSPLQWLLKKTDRIKKGQYTRSGQERVLPVELFTLSKAFDDMAAQVAIRERERDLALKTLKRELNARLKTEEAIKKGQIYMQSLLKAVPTGIAVIRERGFCSVNRRFCRMLGYCREELIGHNSQMMYPSVEEYEQAGMKIYRQLGKIGTGTIETRFKKKDGQIIHVLLNSARIDSAPSDSATMVTVLDITQLKVMEKRIQESQRMESIGSLAGGIVHDFNNLLFPIVGMAELLMEDLIEGSLEHANAAEILSAGMRGRDLVSQILTFSRQQERKKIPLKPHLVVKDAIKLCRSTLPSGIEIVQNLDPHCGRINADPTQLHQVAMNLIINAYHALEDDGGQIIVSLERATPRREGGQKKNPGRFILLSVSDTGPGISPEVLKKIFAPYFTTKPKGKGTGIGLSVVYSIVKEHRGEIFVNTKIGEGATFKVFFPAVDQAGGTDGEAAPRPGFQGGNERILLVDGDRSVARLEKQMLERLGYRVTIAYSSFDALGIFEADPQSVDLVMTDMNMPHMSGEKLATKLVGIRPDVPVILCTGFGDRLDRLRLRRRGIRDILVKPVNKQELAQKIRMVLDQKVSMTPF